MFSLHVIDVPDEFTVQPYEVFDALCRASTSTNPLDHADDLPNWFLRDFAFVITDQICHI